MYSNGKNEQKTASLYKCTVYCVMCIQLSCTQTVYTCIYIYLMFIVKKEEKKEKTAHAFSFTCITGMQYNSRDFLFVK